MKIEIEIKHAPAEIQMLIDEVQTDINQKSWAFKNAITLKKMSKSTAESKLSRLRQLKQILEEIKKTQNPQLL
ncbi:MAG: hypothetical protein ACK5BE_07000 [Alphaproteobacteria bacterium]|jgi:formiminotetrahydrofolate cyclodeaminase